MEILKVKVTADLKEFFDGEWVAGELDSRYFSSRVVGWKVTIKTKRGSLKGRIDDRGGKFWVQGKAFSEFSQAVGSIIDEAYYEK